jgi:hypothetical protein
VLRPFVSRYLDAIEGVRYAHLDQLQRGPLAGIATGGAGTAFALLRAGRARRAISWADDALADRRRAAYRGDGDHVVDRNAYLMGRAGIHVVRALASRDRDASIGAFVRSARGVGPIELHSGRAGHLIGTRVMLDRFDDARLRRLGASLAGELEAAARDRVRAPWQAIDATNLAHGWPGVLYALLRWAEPAPWLVDALVRLTHAWRPDTITGVDNRATWCAGAAGMVLLWSRAHAATREPIFVEAARTAANAALVYEPPRPHLCCGTGGVAYAMLALDRIDPRGGWRARAAEITVRAIRSPVRTAFPNGLLWGFPGLVCLALDVMADRPIGFPAIEG